MVGVGDYGGEYCLKFASIFQDREGGVGVSGGWVVRGELCLKFASIFRGLQGGCGGGCLGRGVGGGDRCSGVRSIFLLTGFVREGAAAALM